MVANTSCVLSPLTIPTFLAASPTTVGDEMGLIVDPVKYGASVSTSKRSVDIVRRASRDPWTNALFCGCIQHRCSGMNR
ncbi:hypothetical protein DPMN_093990 [Dreissena polymorpha]|uniref:Uncharacterized protein n=1 Tax=Dreissena polymorpha TaxID=45954 RepID=A0A9D4L594_DREPO|nr:hypothetical protein DPMN_093990 [Dreissena polymorpha]